MGLNKSEEIKSLKVALGEVDEGILEGDFIS
jgi:hypothetical protein